jgi:hypothetical protein
MIRRAKFRPEEYSILDEPIKKHETTKITAGVFCKE